MPKVKSAPRTTTSRVAPYKKRTPKSQNVKGAALAQAATNDNQEKPRLLFTDLAFEIRLHVYAHFLQVPWAEEDEDGTAALQTQQQATRKDINTTRFSLLSVTHQIREEWRPLFLSTTTLAVSQIQSPNRAQLPARPDGPTRALYNTMFRNRAADFTNVFLKEMPVNLLRCIRTLSYAQVVTMPFGGPQRGLTEFGDLVFGLLAKSLTSLETVIFHGKFLDMFLPIEYLGHEDLAFEELDFHGTVESQIRQLSSTSRRGKLPGWSVEKGVKIEYSDRRWVCCREYKLIFRRQGATIPFTIEEWIQRGRELGLQK